MSYESITNIGQLLEKKEIVMILINFLMITRSITLPVGRTMLQIPMNHTTIPTTATAHTHIYNTVVFEYVPCCGLKMKKQKLEKRSTKLPNIQPFNQPKAGMIKMSHFCVCRKSNKFIGDNTIIY